MKINYMFLLLLLSLIVPACTPHPPIAHTQSTSLFATVPIPL